MWVHTCETASNLGKSRLYDLEATVMPCSEERMPTLVNICILAFPNMRFPLYALGRTPSEHLTFNKQNSYRVRSPNRDICDPGGGLVELIYISKRSGVHPVTHLSYHGIGLQGFSVSLWNSHGRGRYHGLRRTKVGAWMPRTVGVVLTHRAWVTSPKAC